MKHITKAGALVAVLAAVLGLGVGVAGADHGGPHCDELPANITPEHPDWHESLDADHNGVGCEDPDQPPWTPPSTEPPAEPPSTEPPAAPPAPEPARPVEAEPAFTG